MHHRPLRRDPRQTSLRRQRRAAQWSRASAGAASLAACHDELALIAQRLAPDRP